MAPGGTEAVRASPKAFEVMGETFEHTERATMLGTNWSYMAILEKSSETSVDKHERREKKVTAHRLDRLKTSAGWIL